MAQPQAVRPLLVSKCGRFLLTVIVTTGFACPTREQRTLVTASITCVSLSVFDGFLFFKVLEVVTVIYVIHGYSIHDKMSDSFNLTFFISSTFWWIFIL